MKLVKLSYLVGSVDKNNVYFHITCLLPKYRKLLPLSHYTFIDYTVKHIKKTIINVTVCLKYHKQNKKKIYVETIDRVKVTETYVAETLQNKRYCDKFIFF